jgi:hypothetical protein
MATFKNKIVIASYKSPLTRSFLVLLILMIASEVSAQKLSMFNYSSCLPDCVNDSSKITEIKTEARSTTIRLKTYAPCNGNLSGELEIVKNIVNLEFRTKPTIIVDKKGTKSEIIEVADCNCMFSFKYQISGLTSMHGKIIKVNGQSLREIDSKNIVPEETITFELDSIKD